LLRGIHWMCILLLVGPALFSAGCAGDFEHGRFAPAAAVSPFQDWKVTGNLQEPQKAADGSAATAAVARRGHNAQITIDLGTACLFNMIAVNHGPDQFGFCRRLAVLTSLDGKAFDRRTVLPGTRHITVLLLPRPTLARYIRLQVVLRGSRPWSVAEIFVQ